MQEQTEPAGGSEVAGKLEKLHNRKI